MDRRRALIVIVSLIAAPAVSMAAESSTPASVRWQSDLKKAHDLSVRTGRPMLIVFGAEWCTFCHKLEQTTLADPEMVEFVNNSFVPVHIDYDKQPRVAQVLEVKSLPHTVVLSPQADLLGRIVGFADPAKYKAGLDSARELQAKIRTAAAP